MEDGGVQPIVRIVIIDGFVNQEVGSEGGAKLLSGNYRKIGRKNRQRSRPDSPSKRGVAQAGKVTILIAAR